MSDYTVCHKSGQLLFLKLTLIVFIWFYDEIQLQNLKILERGKRFKFWLWNLLCSLFCTSKIWCPICKKIRPRIMLILTQLYLELNIMGGLPDAVLAHAYGKILPAPSYFARVIKYFNRSPIPTLWIISSTECVWDHAKEKISFLLPTIFDWFSKAWKIPVKYSGWLKLAKFRFAIYFDSTIG